MDTVVLGRTGLEVSVAGVGCGGHSRLGQATGATEEESVRLIHRALELDVVLTGTGNPAHLEDNIASINSQPLTTEEAEGLRRLFGHLDHLSGN